MFQVINGKTIKGIYKMKGKKGRYDVRNFESRGAQMETEEHSKRDAKGMFGDQALANKREAIQAAFDESHQERVSKAVEAVPKSLDSKGILSILQSAGLGANTSAASGLATAAQKEAQDGSGESDPEVDDESSSSQSEDEGNAQARVQSLAGKKQAKAKTQVKPAPKASTAKTGGVTRPATSVPQVAPAPSQSPQAAVSSQATKKGNSDDGPAASAKTLNLDGRGMRLRDSLKKELTELKLKFEGLTGFGDDYNFLDKKEHAARHRSLTGVANSIQNSLRRVENSPNKSSFEAEIEGFESLKSLVQTAVEMNAALASSTTGPKVIEDAYDTLKEAGLVQVGSCFLFKLLETKLNEKILFKNLADYVGVLAEDSKEAFWRIYMS